MPDLPPVKRFFKILDAEFAKPKSNPEKLVIKKKCSTCKTTPWECRDCGAKCCEHKCGNKTNSGKLATCISCSQKNYDKIWRRNPESISKQIKTLENKYFGEPDMKSRIIFSFGYTNDELSRIYTEHNLKTYFKTRKYVLYKIISKKPFKIKIRLFKETKIQDEVILKIKNSELIMKLAIIFGLESNDPDIDPVKFLSDYEKDDKYPQPFEVWQQIKRFIKYYDKDVIVEKSKTFL